MGFSDVQLVAKMQKAMGKMFLIFMWMVTVPVVKKYKCKNSASYVRNSKGWRLIFAASVSNPFFYSFSASGLYFMYRLITRKESSTHARLKQKPAITSVAK